MVGNWRFKGLIGIIILIFGFFLMSENTFALVPNKVASSMTVSRSTTSPDWHTVVQNHNTALPIQLLSYQGQTLQVRLLNLSSTVSPSQTGQYFSGSFKIKLRFDWQNQGYPSSMLPSCANISNVYLRPEQGTTVSSNYTVSSCRGSYVVFTGQTGPQAFDLDLTVQGSGKLSASTTVTSYVLSIQSSEEKPFFTGNLTSPNSWGVMIPSGGLDINFNINNDSNTTGQGDINQNITNINNTINNHYDKENQAINNIDNQTAPGGTDNQQSTNLIGVLSSFLSQLSSFQATNCELTLPFPSFIGGSQIVNICQGKDVLGNFITIIGSLTMIVFYVPLALVLLRLIYNEIRSFTNG